MARVKRAVNALKKRRKVFKLSKGYFGAKSKQYRAASEQVRRSLRYSHGFPLYTHSLSSLVNITRFAISSWKHFNRCLKNTG